MTEELAEILQKFALSNKEMGGTALDLGDADNGIMECQSSLVGKIHGEKVVNFVGVKNFVTAAWGYPKEMKALELGPNLFQFILPREDERLRVLDGGPWIIDNQILVLSSWFAGIEEDYTAFNFAPLWIQVWNLPIHWMSKETGKKIGAMVGEVKEVIIPQAGGKEGRHIKIMVKTDISQPLMRGAMIQLNGVPRWIRFKYERCPDFCFCCGRIGHSERTCNIEVIVGRGLLDN